MKPLIVQTKDGSIGLLSNQKKVKGRVTVSILRKDLTPIGKNVNVTLKSLQILDIFDEHQIMTTPQYQSQVKARRYILNKNKIMIRDKEKDKLYLFLNDKYNIQLLDEEVEDILLTAETLNNSGRVSARLMMYLMRMINLVVLALLWLLVKEDYIEYVLLFYLAFNAVVILVLTIHFIWKKMRTRKKQI